MSGAAIASMIEYFNEDRHQVNHALKVYGYAKAIAEGEGLDGDALALVELAAVFHDIGIPEAVRIHGSSAGPHQEQEGARVAGPLLAALGCPAALADKVRFLIGHHHSYGANGGVALQILFEADFFVNIDEGGLDREALQSILEKRFRTATGKRLFDALFGSSNAAN